MKHHTPHYLILHVCTTIIRNMQSYFFGLFTMQSTSSAETLGDSLTLAGRTKLLALNTSPFFDVERSSSMFSGMFISEQTHSTKLFKRTRKQPRRKSTLFSVFTIRTGMRILLPGWYCRKLTDTGISVTAKRKARILR